MKTTDLIKDSLNHSSGRRGFLQNASETEDFESDRKVVKIVVVQKREESHAEKDDLISFEAMMLPHLDAAHNLAKRLLRNEQDVEDVVQEAFLRAFKSFSGFHGSNGRAWLLTIVRNTSYTLLKNNKAVDLTTTFDEEIQALGYDSVTPATILEHSEDAELIREAMDELPAEFREILVLRHQEGLSYKEIADIAQIPPGTVMSRLARARGKLKECLATCGTAVSVSKHTRRTRRSLTRLAEALRITRRLRNCGSEFNHLCENRSSDSPCAVLDKMLIRWSEEGSQSPEPFFSGRHGIGRRGMAAKKLMHTKFPQRQA